MSIPVIQIRQQQALLGMETTPGYVRLEPASVEMRMETRLPRVEIEAPAGEMVIDQSRAWDALSLGSNKRWNERLYTQMKQHVLQYIARIAADGERLMSTAGKGMNTIPRMAREKSLQWGNGLEYAGYASSGNVEVDYIRRQPDFEAVPGQVDVDFVYKPLETEFVRSKLDIYIRQKAQVEVTPPQIELQL